MAAVLEGVPEVKVEVSKEINFDNLTTSTKIPNPGMYRMSPLHEAIWADDLDRVKSLVKSLKKEGELEELLKRCDRDERPPLVYAIIRKNKEIVQFLLDEKAPADHKNDDSDLIGPLLEKGAKPNVSSKGKRPITPLLLACALGQPDAVDLLLKHGADSDVTYSVPPDEEFNPLMLTMHSSEIKSTEIREKICLSLIEAGVNTLIPREDNCTPLTLAIHYNLSQVARVMIEREICMPEKIATNKYVCALWVAMQRRNQFICNLLISNKCPIFSGKNKSTPMHAAVKANFLHGVLVLLEYDHPVNVTDKAGYTPLHYAAVLPDTTILKTFLSKGINVGLTSRKIGLTPLHCAAYAGSVPALEVLLGAGSQIEKKDKQEGMTPLIAAIDNNKADAVRFLIEKGADISNRKGAWGITPLVQAIALSLDSIRDIICETAKKNPDLRGMLKKKGGGRRRSNWKLRLFILKGTYLFYYKSPDQISPQGIIILDGCNVEASQKRDTQFQIVTKHRAYQMLAGSAKEMKDWWDAIEAAVKTFNPEAGQGASQGFTTTIAFPLIPDW